MEKKAIVLCSGGIDSVVTAYFVRKKLGYKKMKILFFDYRQKSLISERKFSRMCAHELKAEFMEISIPELGKMSGSLINKNGKAGRLSINKLKNTKKESKKWYVPARNLVFLAYAISLAESIFLRTKERYNIFTGFKCEGQEHYPDTTEGFVKSMNKISLDSTEGKFKIIAPLISKDKEDIIKTGSGLGVDFTKTFSCYQDNVHCGQCLSCCLRKAGFYWAGMKDTTKYGKNN